MAPRVAVPLLALLLAGCDARGLLLPGHRPAAAAPPVVADPRPFLEVRQGRCFAWAQPPGWRSSESIAGVEVTSPDGLMGASSSLLMRSRGSARPRDFALSMLGRVPGVSGLRLLEARALPGRPSGYPGRPWTVEQLELAFLYRGVPSRAAWDCGVVNLPWGTYDAFLAGCQAPATQFEQARLFLTQIAGSIRITDVRRVAGNDTLLVPRNNPLDNSALIGAWRRKGLSEDRLSQARREGTMGYERMRDPATGRTWDMPYERYDAAAGGYRNPYRPTELLQKAQPGQ